MNKNYTKLLELSKKNTTLTTILNLLDWDQETYMPQGAIELRAAQSEAMATVVHKAKTSASFAKLLGSLIDLETGVCLDKDLTAAQKAALREWRRDFLMARKLPNGFVKTFAQTTSKAIHEWVQAKEKNSFSHFAPHLEKVVSLCRKKAELLGYEEHPYDALLDLFEPGMRTSTLIALFDRLKKPLKELVERPRKEMNRDFLFQSFDKEKQFKFGEQILEVMGFDRQTSRLDHAPHPFCSGLHPKDIRMTTKVHEKYFPACLYAVMHEAGHGLYHAGLKEENFGSPLGESVSLGIDESQSRWWETRIGHGLPFCHYLLPLLQKEFPQQLENVGVEHFYRAINWVKPSFIRIEADEVTYSLHIIVRFEIEKALIEGSLRVKDLPEAWNAKMQQYLGICPPTDAEGCLQDIHWSMGGIGYFPTYALGNLYGAQFFTVFEKNHPQWKEKVSQGDLEFITKWLRENIHQYGRQYAPEELVKQVTGSPLSEKAFVDYLHAKYGDL